MKYSVVNRNLIESLLDFEFKMPHSDSYFYPGFFLTSLNFKFFRIANIKSI
jgi:hypothetical protein